jgi:hypothetical protein
MDSPKKPTRKKSPEATKEKPPEAGVLETVAQAVGTTLGSIAVKTGIVHAKAPAKAKVPKLAKKDKHRVPRKLKKHLQKQAARKTA